MKKIAIIFGAKIGDIICTTPLCSALKHKYPNSEIIYITMPSGKEVAQNISTVDKVIIFDKDGICKNKITFIKETLKIRKQHKFDIAICINATFRWAFFTWLLGAKKRIGRNGQQREIFLTDVYKVKNEDYKKHIIDFFLQLLEPIGLYNQKFKTTFNYTEKDIQHINYLLKKINCENRKLICISPCTAEENKNWTVKETANFIKMINEKTNYKIVLTGDKTGKNFAQQIKDLGVDKFIDLTTKITLTQFAALLKTCEKFITADTGSAHIAYALEVPSIIFFFHKNFNLWGPKDLNTHKIIYKEKKDLLTAKEIFEALNLTNQF